MIEYLLPYFEERKSNIDMLVFHASAHNGDDLVKCLEKQRLSAHYVIDENGQVIKLVDEKYRAYHAGVSYWRGVEDINSHSIGIEIASLSLGQKKYKKKQIQTLIDFSNVLIDKYKIPGVNILGHSDVAPLRKPDPGIGFPWRELANNGIGLWFDESDAVNFDGASVRELLEIIGYDVRSPEAMSASAYAFCRRFIPSYVSKVDDISVLVENFLPDDYEFMQKSKFKKILQAVAWKYKIF